MGRVAPLCINNYPAPVRDVVWWEEAQAFSTDRVSRGYGRGRQTAGRGKQKGRWKWIMEIGQYSYSYS